jgi:hypothetical protein
MADPDEVQLSKLAKKMLAMPHKKREDSKLGKPRTKPTAPNAPQKAMVSDGVMIVYDVQMLPNGEAVIGKPYRRFPDGSVASLIAS